MLLPDLSQARPARDLPTWGWHETNIALARKILQEGFRTGMELGVGERSAAVFLAPTHKGTGASYVRGGPKARGARLRVSLGGLRVLDSSSLLTPSPTTPSWEGPRYRLKQHVEDYGIPQGWDGVAFYFDGRPVEIALTSQAATRNLEPVLYGLVGGKPLKEQPMLSRAARLAVRVASVKLASDGYFALGDMILYGKWKNLRGRIVSFGHDEHGHPTIEVEPIPKGRKQNRLIQLYRIWHDPQAVAPKQASRVAVNFAVADEPWLVPRSQLAPAATTSGRSRLGTWRVYPNGIVEQLQVVPLGDFPTLRASQFDEDAVKALSVQIDRRGIDGVSTPVVIREAHGKHQVLANAISIAVAKSLGFAAMPMWVSWTRPGIRRPMTHEELVEDALARGYFVPPVVLREYSHLRPSRAASRDAS